MNRFAAALVAALATLATRTRSRAGDVEADQADHDHRAVGGRRVDRPGDARHRRRDREGARPEGRDRQPAGRVGLDRHQERDGSAEGRLHVDRRRGQGPRHLQGARHARHEDSATGRCSSTSPTSRRCRSIRTRRTRRVDELIDAMKAKPGQISVATAGVNSSGHSAMEAIARAGRRQVQARHLRRRQSGGRRDRRRRNRRHDAAHRRAGRDDPRQAAAAARGRRRQADRARRLRHDRAADQVAAAASRSPPNYFGIFIPKSVPPEVIATVEKIWAEQHHELDGAEEVRDEQRRAVRAVVRRRRDEGGDARRAGQRVAGVRRRQGEGLARHARHRAAVSGRRGRLETVSSDATGSSAAPPGSRHRRRLGRARRRDHGRLVAHGPARERRACRGSRRPGCVPGIVGVLIVADRARRSSLRALRARARRRARRTPPRTTTRDSPAAPR